MFFVSMMMCEIHDEGEVVYGIVTCLIAISNMILGFSEFKRNILAATGDDVI